MKKEEERKRKKAKEEKQKLDNKINEHLRKWREQEDKQNEIYIVKDLDKIYRQWQIKNDKLLWLEDQENEIWIEKNVKAYENFLQGSFLNKALIEEKLEERRKYHYENYLKDRQAKEAVKRADIMEKLHYRRIYHEDYFKKERPEKEQKIVMELTEEFYGKIKREKQIQEEKEMIRKGVEEMEAKKQKEEEKKREKAEQERIKVYYQNPENFKYEKRMEDEMWDAVINEEVIENSLLDQISDKVLPWNRPELTKKQKKKKELEEKLKREESMRNYGKYGALAPIQTKKLLVTFAVRESNMEKISFTKKEEFCQKPKKLLRDGAHGPHIDSPMSPVYTNVISRIIPAKYLNKTKDFFDETVKKQKKYKRRLEQDKRRPTKKKEAEFWKNLKEKKDKVEEENVKKHDKWLRCKNLKTSCRPFKVG